MRIRTRIRACRRPLTPNCVPIHAVGNPFINLFVSTLCLRLPTWPRTVAPTAARSPSAAPCATESSLSRAASPRTWERTAEKGRTGTIVKNMICTFHDFGALTDFQIEMWRLICMEISVTWVGTIYPKFVLLYSSGAPSAAKLFRTQAPWQSTSAFTRAKSLTSAQSVHSG
jgi:hypothetical protein